jgi:VanZ family protein
MPRPPVPEAMSFPHADKVLHAIGYAGLCTLAVLGATSARLLLAFALTVAWGAIDELHQGFVPGRERSFLDLVADCAGAALVVALVSAVRHRRERNSPALDQPS